MKQSTWHQRKGVVDLSFFDDLTDQLKFKTEICETTRDFVKDALEDAVSRSDIGHVDLSMQDEANLKTDMESDDNRLNGVGYTPVKMTNIHILSLS